MSLVALKNAIKKIKGNEYSKVKENQLLHEWNTHKTLNEVIIILIEEISEIIQSMTLFLNNDMKDGYIDIVEEYVDVKLSTKIIYLKIDKKFNKSDINRETISPTSFPDILYRLSRAQQILTKFLRNKRTIKDIEEALELITYALSDTKKLFSIKKINIKKMKTIKLDKIRNRIDTGNIN